MKIKQFILFLAGIYVSATTTFAQNSIVSVNPVTGTANAVIPIDEIHNGQASLPVNLVYSGSGIRPKDVEMNAGMGWHVEVGGQVARQVRGLPDDCKKDNSGNARLGWIYNSNQSLVNSFTIQNNGSTCSNETTDLSYISSNFSNLSDTEPDVFYVSAPGLSCRLVWDQSMSTPGFRTIPYKDYVITPTFDSTSGAITSFTIINDNGIKYVFSSPESIKQTTIIVTGATINFFKNTYSQYQYGINYYNNWHLTSVSDPSGNGASIQYTTATTARSSTDSLVLYTGGASGATTRIPQYRILQTVSPQTISQIGILDLNDFVPQLTFNWQTSGTNAPIISTITGRGKTYQFTYSSVGYGSQYAYTRSFLRNFTDLGCSSPINYNFTYSGETYYSTAHPPYYSTTLPDSSSTHIDYWGYADPGVTTSLTPAIYVNPSNSSYPRYTISALHVGSDYNTLLTATNRSTSPTGVIAGSLTKIYYAQGGNTTINYESNDYLDVPSNTTVYGGGIRVNSIIDSAINSTFSTVRGYTYKSPPFTGASSGKPISLPQFAFSTPYTGTATGNDYWNFSTIRSQNDLSPEDHTIMYSYVRETVNGASTLYQYYVPATNWDNTATPACASCTADWSPTIDYVGRTNCTQSYGPVANSAASYPFAPNPNYDFERGLPVKTTAFDDDGTEVSETNYIYQRSSSTPSIIRALNFDDNISSGRTVRSYAKYAIYASTSELTSTVAKKVFDLNSSTNAQTSTTSYTYNTGQHKLAKQTATNSDGSIVTTNIKYAKDYTTSGTNPDVVAISNLQSRNINIPIEVYQQVTRGTVTKTTSATLTRFKADSISGGGVSYLPLQQLKFYSAVGDSLFTPYTITGGTPSYYSGYLPTANFTNYDTFGNLLTTDDAHKHVRTVFKDYFNGTPTAVFQNAGVSEVGYSNFDTGSGIYTPAYFTLSGTTSYASSSHVGVALNFGTSQNFSKTIIKNSISKRYIFSIWMNAPTGTNTLTFTLTGGSTSTYARTYTGTGGWKYYQFSIPVNNLSATFTLSFTTSVNILVDDLLLYPENSEVMTYSYDPTTHFKVSETNTNGISTYYNYDQWGRLIYVYDQDKNIIQKNTFVLPVDLQKFSKPEIGINGSYYVNTPMTFSTTGYNECTGFGISSQWNFGDGTNVTTSNMTQPHTYTATGTYTVYLTGNSEVFGTKSDTATVTIINPPAPPPSNITLSYNNYTTSNGNISSVTFNDGVHTPVSVAAANLNGYVLAPGTYTIQVTFVTGSSPYNSSSGSGYGCINISGTCFNQCKDYDVHNIYTYTNVNMTTCSSMNFSVYTTNCATTLQ